jgi:predicted O-methyltransferase YrrM
MNHFWQQVSGWFDEQDIDFYRSQVAQAPSPAHFVEVGSWKGRSSAFMAVEIINSGKTIKFDCVDTWLGDAGIGMSQDAYIQSGTLYEHFLANLKPVEGHYTPVRATSVEAAALYEDDSLDFVFIDAAHDYDNVLADITAWLPKVKVGGVISGHDYTHEPVRRAVHELLENVKNTSNCWYTTKTI